MLNVPTLASMKLPLFEHANTLFRAAHYADAAKLYDHLALLRPGFALYAQGAALALAALAQQGDGRAPNVRLPGVVLQDALLIRSLEVLLRRGLLAPGAWREQAGGARHQADFALLGVLDAVAAPHATWVAALNDWLARIAEPARLLLHPDPDESAPAGRFAAVRFDAQGQVPSGPSVTVAMSCFNNADTVKAAALSVLGQTHRNLELVIVDDASTDGSASVITELVQRDPRIKVHFNERNVGTYANRNQIFAESRAEFFCCLDADDIALPGRVAQQCAALARDPRALGVISRWIRMTGDGRPVTQNVEQGGFAHYSVSTMMLRREPVLATLGYWDVVRFEADSEYMNRLIAVHGAQALLWSDAVVGLALSRPGSLTQDAATGLDDILGPSADRLQYRQSWLAWHASSERLFLAQDQQPRKFATPARML